jgi:formyl-CoA transferase
VPSAIADRIVGVTAVGGILASLVARQRTGRGERVDIPMFETMVAFVMGDHLGGLSFEPPLDEGGYQRQLSPERRPYRTSDGYICAMVYNDKQWDSFLRAVGRESLLQNDARFAGFVNRSNHIDFVYGELSRIFEERSTAEWMALLEAADIPMLPMHDFKSVLQDPHLVATGFFAVEQHPSEGTVRTMKMPMRWHGNTPDPVRPAPRQGEHSVEVLQQAGYGAAEITQLIAQGVVQAAPPLNTDTP